MAFEPIDYSLRLASGAKIDFLNDTEGFMAIKIELGGGQSATLPVTQAEAIKFIRLAQNMAQAVSSIK